jgi:uncharacterized protein YprB with RNaseH-like and TPR domain
MKVPITRLKKDELVKLAGIRCKHGHTLLEHYQCYEGAKERIGFFDIETSNLDANFGLILSYCIKDSDSDKIYQDVISLKDIKSGTAGDEDRRVVESCVEDMKKFTKLVGYYSTKFDIPFVRTRAVSLGIEFPDFGVIKHQDIYYLVKSRFKLNSNRLENACRVLLGETDKTKIEYKYWRGGMRGDPKSLAYILEHNKYDVLDLEKLYHKVIQYARPQEKSM